MPAPPVVRPRAVCEDLAGREHALIACFATDVGGNVWLVDNVAHYVSAECPIFKSGAHRFHYGLQ